MKRNILAENMRRFNTKNLNEGPTDVIWLTNNSGKIQQMLNPDTPEEEKIRIGKEIKADGEKENWMGRSYTAMERLEGAMESIDSLTGMIKKFMPDNPNPLRLGPAKQLLINILGNVDLSSILRALATVATELGVEVIPDESEREYEMMQ